MSRTALLGIFSVAAAVALDLAPASAQGGGYPLYPWCASYGGGRGGGTNCYFSTWDQCRQAASGNGGYCYRNTWYDAYGATIRLAARRRGAARPAISGPPRVPEVWTSFARSKAQGGGRLISCYRRPGPADCSA